MVTVPATATSRAPESAPEARISATSESAPRAISSMRARSAAEGGSPGAARSVRRTAPIWKLRRPSGTGPRPQVTSDEPPPTSRTARRRPAAPKSPQAERWTSRASSPPAMISGAIPAAARQASKNAAPFRASRAALVATAAMRPAPSERASAA